MRKTVIALAIAIAFGPDPFLDRMNREDAKKWLAPIRKALTEVKEGEVDSIQGYAVTRLHDQDDYARLDFCLNGFTALLERLGLALDMAPAHRMSKRLAAGVPLTEEEVDSVLAILDQAETKLIGLRIRHVLAAVTAEQIVIELDSLGLRKAA